MIWNCFLPSSVPSPSSKSLMFEFVLIQ
jgi:hypothetical protein